MKRKTFWIVLSIFILAISLPYIIALSLGGSQFVFGGFLVNPLDGNSYLAKMQEGMQGAWKFTLPYTAQTTQGEWIFLFYVLLGHLTIMTSISPVLMFHLIRVLAAVWLAFEIKWYFERTFPESKQAATIGFIWSLFGAGLGWLLLPFQVVASDMWVAEGFPFLSSFVNPHFPLSMALLLLLIRQSQSNLKPWKLLIVFLAGAVLAIIYPFGIIVAGVLFLAKTIWELFLKEYRTIPYLAALGLGGVPYVLYQYIVTQRNPDLFQWNMQNQTPAPAIWDLIISFSPALLLAFLGMYYCFKRKKAYSFRLSLTWLAAGILLIYLPFNLQRRFIFGLYLPIIPLALFGIQEILRNEKLRRNILRLAMAMSFLTNIVLILLAFGGMATRSPQYYLTRGEFDALGWIRRNTDEHSIFLSSPQMGLLIPAYTGRRVVYGHPFETVDAALQEQTVLQFWNNRLSNQELKDFFVKNGVQYIFDGPREAELGVPSSIGDWKVIYAQEGVTIYATDE